MLSRNSLSTRQLLDIVIDLYGYVWARSLMVRYEYFQRRTDGSGAKFASGNGAVLTEQCRSVPGIDKEVFR